MQNDYLIDDVAINFVGIADHTRQEAFGYLDYVRQNVCLLAQDRITSITISGYDDGTVDIDFQIQGPKFERIRRITGYLSGSLDSWNDSKRAEEKDRVKHVNFDDFGNKKSLPAH